MPAEDDKYPASTGRRRFVKGVVGSASLAGVGTAAAAGINSTTAPTGEGGGTTTFMAVENTSGPAPRGMPQIPVEIDSEGYLKGVFPEWEEQEVQGRTVNVAETELGGRTYSAEWFQYCGVQTYPGLQPDADQDSYFRYTGNSKFDWQNESVEEGDRMHVDDFADYESWGNGIGQDGLGKPAQGSWRSQDVSASEGVMPIEVIRSTRIEEMAQGNQWLSAATEEGFMAHLNKCTHFCCVPTFKGLESSRVANAQNDIYCQCHQSVYDPFSIVEKSFVSLPRPGDS